MRPMIRNLGLVALAYMTLLGCRTPAERSAAEADRIANALGDYIALRCDLPSDINALQKFAADGSYGVNWKRLTKVSFFPIFSNVVRVECTETSGAYDYRNVLVAARGVSPFMPTGTNDVSQFLSDPKTIFKFFSSTPAPN